MDNTAETMKSLAEVLQNPAVADLLKQRIEASKGFSICTTCCMLGGGGAVPIGVGTSPK